MSLPSPWSLPRRCSYCSVLPSCLSKWSWNSLGHLDYIRADGPASGPPARQGHLDYRQAGGPVLSGPAAPAPFDDKFDHSDNLKSPSPGLPNGRRVHSFTKAFIGDPHFRVFIGRNGSAESARAGPGGGVHDRAQARLVAGTRISPYPSSAVRFCRDLIYSHEDEVLVVTTERAMRQRAQLAPEDGTTRDSEVTDPVDRDSVLNQARGIRAGRTCPRTGPPTLPPPSATPAARIRVRSAGRRRRHRHHLLSPLPWLQPIRVPPLPTPSPLQSPPSPPSPPPPLPPPLPASCASWCCRSVRSSSLDG